MRNTLQRGYTCSRGLAFLKKKVDRLPNTFLPHRATYHTFLQTRNVNYQYNNSNKWKYAIGASVGGLMWYWLSTTQSCEEQETQEQLPHYTREEVAKHKTKETGIWVIYKDGVYDITEFVDQHPGGLEKIMLAAGSHIDPFWHVYQQHQVAHIREMLEMFRIGDLHPDDRRPIDLPKVDPYVNDPPRLPDFTVSSEKPFNAEPPLEILTNMITPNEYFFVRNHLPVPQVDPNTYVLEISGEGVRHPIRLTLEDLKRFPKHELTAVIQCAGNRRSELTKVRPVKGLGWGAGAISNAVWGGVYLKDILREFGIDENTATFKHLQFEGLDKDITNQSYGGSVPVDIYRNTDVLLAYEMNGEELPRDHGFPVRAVVPGIVGARNVKWLSKVILSPEESKAFWQTSDYKGFSPSVTWETVDYSSAPAIQELPVQSAILSPKPGTTVSPKEPEISIKGRVSWKERKIVVKGYAWSGGGKGIVRVDVSVDGGKTWHVANLQRPDQERGKEWGWTQWQAKVPIEKENLSRGKLDIVCKAVDTSYNTQPDTVDHIWNFRGVLCNSWHHVNVDVSRSAPAEA